MRGNYEIWKIMEARSYNEECKVEIGQDIDFLNYDLCIWNLND